MECPFFNDASHPACGDMARIENLDHALSHCCGNYKACSRFWQQVQTLRQARQAVRAERAAAAAATLVTLAG